MSCALRTEPPPPFLHFTSVATCVNIAPSAQVGRGMPQTRAPLEFRVLCKDGDFEWRVERLRRVKLVEGVRVDCRFVRFNLRDKTYFDPTPTAHFRGGRVDFRVRIKPLGGLVYLHRAAGYAWRGTHYEHLGGERKKLPKDLSYDGFRLLGLEVHHGPNGAAEIFVDSLLVCTPQRNKEIECDVPLDSRSQGCPGQASIRHPQK